MRKSNEEKQRGKAKWRIDLAGMGRSRLRPYAEKMAILSGERAIARRWSPVYAFYVNAFYQKTLRSAACCCLCCMCVSSGAGKRTD